MPRREKLIAQWLAVSKVAATNPSSDGLAPDVEQRGHQVEIEAGIVPDVRRGVCLERQTEQELRVVRAVRLIEPDPFGQHRQVVDAQSHGQIEHHHQRQDLQQQPAPARGEGTALPHLDRERQE